MPKINGRYALGLRPADPGAFYQTSPREIFIVSPLTAAAASEVRNAINEANSDSNRAGQHSRGIGRGSQGRLAGLRLFDRIPRCSNSEHSKQLVCLPLWPVSEPSHGRSLELRLGNPGSPVAYRYLGATQKTALVESAP